MTLDTASRRKIVVAVGVAALGALLLAFVIYLIGERAKNSYEEIWQRSDFSYRELSTSELKQKILDESARLQKEYKEGVIDRDLMGDVYAYFDEYTIRTADDAEVNTAYDTLATLLGNCWANTGLYDECKEVEISIPHTEQAQGN